MSIKPHNISIVPGQKLAVISETYYGSLLTDGFSESTGCDWNNDEENRSYVLHLSEVYQAENYHINLYYNLTNGNLMNE